MSSVLKAPLPDRLAIAVSFFYVEGRLTYLGKVGSEFLGLAHHVSVFLVTNTSDVKHHQLIRETLTGVHLEIIVPEWLGHPYLLTWVHREVFRREAQKGVWSHFLYLEDDLHVTTENVSYWMRAREELRAHGLIPSFLRYEVRPDGSRVSTDVTVSYGLNQLPHLMVNGNTYVNFKQPYQGLYLMDDELMREFISSPAFSPDFGKWNIREKAAQGLTFYRVPKNCFSRNFVGCLPDGNVMKHALVHHLPNNYAENEHSKFGKLPLNRILV